ncbi:MAG: ornithine cyclodeaminase [Jannaschia sp.]
MTHTYIGYENAFDLMSWHDAVDALRRGHLLPRAKIADVFLGPSDATLLNRSAYIEGFGFGVKAVTVVRDNAVRDLPTTQGAMMLYDPDTGSLRAIIDSRLVTKVKTVSDSLLGAQLLAPPASRRLLIVGAGEIAEALVRGYASAFPALEQIAIWARRPEQAQALVEGLDDMDANVIVADDLSGFAAAADIVSSATMARDPVLRGDWISPGTHIDLIGAFKADMREADDVLMRKGTLFVDSRDTTVHHIGELTIPIAAGIITEADVRADLYDLIEVARPARTSADEITIFKNGGGAHLDLMIADYIVRAIGGQS